MLIFVVEFNEEYINRYMVLTSIWGQWWMPFVIMAGTFILILLVKVIIGLIKKRKK